LVDGGKGGSAAREKHVEVEYLPATKNGHMGLAIEDKKH